MECLWLKMEAVLASSPQTLPKKQKVSCFLVSYMPLACAPRATAAYARGGPFGFDRARAQLAQTAGITSRRAVSLPDASTSQEPLHDRSALLPRARLRTSRGTAPRDRSALAQPPRTVTVTRIASQAPGRE